MMQKRKLSSLLLISFIVVFAFSYAAANTVTYEEKTVLRCDQVNQNVTASPTQDIAGFELVFVTNSGGVEAAGLNVTVGPDVPAGWYFDVDDSRIGTGTQDTVRVIGLRLNAGLDPIAVGDAVVAVLHYTTNDVCDGTITFEGAEWTDYPNPVGTIETQFAGTDAAIIAAAVTAGVVTVENQPVGINAIADQTVHWGHAYSYTAVGTDDDLANGCEVLEYFLTTPPTGMVIDSETGVITWDPVPGANVCDNTVTVRVEDVCGSTTSTSFVLCVENDAPAFTCDDLIDVEDPAIMCEGDIAMVGVMEYVEGTVTAVDPDDGPNPLQFNIIGWINPGGAPQPVMNPNDGSFTWTADVDPLATSFLYEMVVEVTDNAAVCDCAPANADTASFFFEVVPLRFYIEKDHGPEGKGVPQGQFTTVSVLMPDNTEFINRPIGGFEFLIQYDNSALTLMEVTPGDFITECDWEYFTYRQGPFGNCGDACPSGMIRIVALAEYNNGAEHPICFDNTDGFNVLANMKYLVSNDHTLECMFVPIRFFWLDCNDNSVSDQEGMHLFIGRNVYDYVGTGGVDSYYLLTGDRTFPSIYGPEAWCVDVTDSLKPEIYDYIDFFNGGVDIICHKDIDDRGDLNMDGVAYSIADAVMFSNYFIVGLSAFPVGMEDGSVAASDINADGYTLTVADLVYLIRVIVGDAVPYDNPFLKPVTSTYRYDNGVVNVEGDMGAAAFVFEGEVSVELMAPDMELKVKFDGVNTKAVVYSLEGNSFTGDVVKGNGLISLELGSADGAMVTTEWLPSHYALNQNYPNPFNPSTNVSFDLPNSADVQLAVYNIAGQVVAQYGGFYEAGSHVITIDASDKSSGIYFYKLTAGDFSETKKMVLLK